MTSKIYKHSGISLKFNFDATDAVINYLTNVDPKLNADFKDIIGIKLLIARNKNKELECGRLIGVDVAKV